MVGMDAAMWGFIGTIVGAFVGATASVATTWINSSNAHRLQLEATRQERADRASEFQRQTLLALQEELHDLMRLGVRAHLEDLQSHRQGGEWGRTLLGEELSDSIRLTLRRVGILADRLSDDALRTRVTECRTFINGMIFATSEAESEERVRHATSFTDEALRLIGDGLRKTFAHA